MASLTDPDEDIFENLKKGIDPELLEKREREVNERIHIQYEKAQRRLAELIELNTTLPVTISSVSLLGAFHTRKSFLKRIFDPLLSANRDAPYTLAEALQEVAATGRTLQKFDIFQPPISVFFDGPLTPDPLSPTTDLAVFLSVREKPRLLLKTGTDLGNTEGSAYGNLLLRNVFGGAESLNVNASIGTRTKSAYSIGFESPILSNPDIKFELGGLASSTNKFWASHEEALKGIGAKVRWLAKGGNRHEVGYSGVWRQITGLAENASPTARGDAGDSFKSSVSHVWINDQRDHPLLPSRGYYLKSLSEIAGWGPLSGDVAFWKSETESQLAFSIPVPGVRPNAVTFTTGLRAGLLYPLTLGRTSTPQRSRLNDRFQLGGPTDVRGFRLSGLGPRDGPDAVGGDVYAAGSANILFPFPRVGADRPLRLQAFVNGGRLLALKGDITKDGESVQRTVYSTVAELFNGLPSAAAGIGIIYAHPAARFELNFSLPLSLRKGEEGRKGLQLGVGINFL